MSVKKLQKLVSKLIKDSFRDFRYMTEDQVNEALTLMKKETKNGIRKIRNS